MYVAVVLDVLIDPDSLESWSVVTRLYWLFFVVFGKSPTRFIATKSSDPDVEKSCSLRRQEYLRVRFLQF